jgi:hypothetical protein
LGLTDPFEQWPEGAHERDHAREPPLQLEVVAVNFCVWDVCRVKLGGVIVTVQLAWAFGRNIRTAAASSSFFINSSFEKCLTSGGEGFRVANRVRQHPGCEEYRAGCLWIRI